MKLRRDIDRENREPVIVPLVNIVFLLLIFFMLVGRVTPPEAVPVEPPRSTASTLSTGNGDPVVLISATRRLALNDVEMEEDLLLSAITELRAQDPSLTIRVKADAELEAEHLLRIMESLQRAGIARLLLLTERPPS